MVIQRLTAISLLPAPLPPPILISTLPTVVSGPGNAVNNPEVPYSTSYSGAFDNPTTFNVTNTATSAVPEPGSLVLCGFAACALGFCTWRRNRATSQKTRDEDKLVS